MASQKIHKYSQWYLVPMLGSWQKLVWADQSDQLLNVGKAKQTSKFCVVSSWSESEAILYWGIKFTGGFWYDTKDGDPKIITFIISHLEIYGNYLCKISIKSEAALGNRTHRRELQWWRIEIVQQLLPTASVPMYQHMETCDRSLAGTES